MMDGLKDKYRKAIIDILSANERVEKVVLFGSRAMGTFTPTSDVDIALFGDNLTLTDQAKLAEAIEELSIPQRIDILPYKSIKNEKLIEHIKRYGVEWHERCGTMRKEWRQSTWGEEMSLEYGKALRGYKDAKGSYRVYGSNGPVGWTSEPLAPGPGIILGRKGAYRGVEYSKAPFFVIDTAYYVKPKTNLQMRWVYYAIKHYKLGEIDDGSPIPSTTRAAVYVRDLQIPHSKEQHAIAHILGSLDDKIELNRRMNKTLEDTARAIFKSWFIDFDPVIDNVLWAGNPIPDRFSERVEVRRQMLDQNQNGVLEIVNNEKAKKKHPETLPFTIHLSSFPSSFQDSDLGEIPKGWKSRSLYDSTKYINGAAYRSFHFTDEEGALPVVKIAELKNGVTGQTKFTKVELDDKYRIADGEILLSWSGNPDTSIDTFVWSGGAAWLNQHIFRVLPHQEIEKHFIFYLLKYLRPVFAEIARDKQTTGLGHFTVRDMKRLMVIHPPEELLAKFNDLVGPIFNRWYGNLFESNTLASLRDTLLPKLISGELRVPDAEILLEAAI